MALSDITPISRPEEFLQRIADAIEGGGGSGLPEVTSEDNGDVLAVVNGAWAKAPAPSSLPPYTSADKGKGLFLGDGEAQTVVVVPEQTVTAEAQTPVNLTGAVASYFVAGQEATLTVNGTSYDVTAVEEPEGVMFATDVGVLAYLSGIPGFEDGAYFMPAEGGTYTVSLIASVPSVEAKWEGGNNILTLPGDVVTEFNSLATQVVMAALSAGDYLPHYIEGNGITISDSENESILSFMNRYIRHTTGCLFWNGVYAPVTMLVADYEGVPQIAWFTLPLYSASEYKFSLSVSISVYEGNEVVVRIVLQQIKEENPSD